MDFDGASAFDLAYEEGVDWPLNTGYEVCRDDAPCRIKQVFTQTPDQFFLTNGDFQENAKGKDGEILEVFLTHKGTTKTILEKTEVA